MSTKPVRDRIASMLLCAALIAAVLLSAGLLLRLRDQEAASAALKGELAESMAIWGGINEEKVALQAQLTEAQNALREASLSLEESTAKIASIKPQLEELEEKTPLLRAAVAQAQSEAEREKQANADVAAATEALRDAVADLKASRASGGDTDAAEAAVTAAMDALRAAMAALSSGE